MARLQTVEALVLRTVDVGEADRFCILFTRERGRLAARARGVRKPGSRMGGALLPFSHVRMDFAESDHSLTVTSASLLCSHVSERADYAAFACLERGAELALTLTEDDEPLINIFDLLVAFVHAVHAGYRPLLPFALCFLACLGLLPAQEEDLRFARLSPAAKAFVRTCDAARDVETLCMDVPDEPALKQFLDAVLEEHIRKPLVSW